MCFQFKRFNRDIRYNEDIPRDKPTKPKKLFYNSNYKRLYDDCTDLRQSNIVKSLNTISKKAAKAYNSKISEGKSLGEAGVYIYTTNLIYRQVNNAIVTDNKRELQKLMPYIKVIVEYIKSLPPLEESLIVYRANKLTSKQLNDFIPNRNYQNSMFLSTTESLDVAEKWYHTYIHEIEIPKGVTCILKAKEISEFPDEVEVILPPWIPLECISNDPSPRTKFRVVLDNLDIYEHNYEGQTMLI